MARIQQSAAQQLRQTLSNVAAQQAAQRGQGTLTLTQGRQTLPHTIAPSLQQAAANQRPVAAPTAPAAPARTPAPAVPQETIAQGLERARVMAQNIQRGIDTLRAREAAASIKEVVPERTPEQIAQDNMRDMMARFQTALGERTPEPQGLTQTERQLFADQKTQLKARYDTALDSLRRQQERDRERLVGRYATMGFTEPGVIEGPMAGTPGIITQALQETGEAQRRELADLEQARTGGILEIAQATQEAERRARAEEAQQFERNRETMIRNLERQIQLARPEEFTIGNRMFQRDRITGAITEITPPGVAQERFTAGGRIFQRDQVTGVITDVTPPEALQRQVEVERGGRRLQITIDAEGREVGVIDLGPARVAEPAGPASFQEWVLAGGQAGTGMSYKEWVEWRRQPAGGLLPGETAL